MENEAGAQVSVQDLPKERKFIVYWFEWAAVVRDDRKISFNHRHELKYIRAQQRKGCSLCKAVPPAALKGIIALQQLRKHHE